MQGPVDPVAPQGGDATKIGRRQMHQSRLRESGGV
jgi:hypothetical protein